MTEQRYTMDSYGRIVAADMGLTRYVKVEDLFRCETCKHGDNGLCNAFMWCEHHEEYIPDIRKLNVTADVQEVVRCKECKYFELNHVDIFNGVPLITAHEVCTKWSEGCKTDSNGFCFLGERKAAE